MIIIAKEIVIMTGLYLTQIFFPSHFFPLALVWAENVLVKIK